MTRSKERYLNFPIQLLQGFILNDKVCLINICDYAIYVHSLKLDYGNNGMSRFKSSASYYGVTFDSIKENYLNGKMLFDSIELKSPMTGLNITIYWDFIKNKKTEFEKVSLLALLALKSIIGFKPYCKVTNRYWLSRMDGKIKAIDNKCDLSKELRKYYSEYQTKKIKRELHLNWGLKDYGRYTRGFYASFSLTMDQLVYEAEKRRESYKEKTYKNMQNESLKKALLKLGISQ